MKVGLWEVFELSDDVLAHDEFSQSFLLQGRGAECREAQYPPVVFIELLEVVV